MKSSAIPLPRIPALPGSPARDFYAAEETASHTPGGSPLGHYHKEAECLYVLEGNLSFQVNESRMVLHEGDVLIVLPGILHHDLIHEEGTRLIQILMDPALLTREADIRRRLIHPFFDSGEKACLLLPAGRPFPFPSCSFPDRGNKRRRILYRPLQGPPDCRFPPSPAVPPLPGLSAGRRKKAPALPGRPGNPEAHDSLHQ